MPTATIYGHTDDGYIHGSHGNYPDARDTSVAWSAGSSIYVGHDLVPTGSYSLYYVYRGYLLFDTSVLPAGAVVTDARLSLQVGADYSDTDFDVEIYRFAWVNPMSDGNRETNYDVAGAVYECVWRNTTGIALDTYYQSPALDVAGINLSGYTKYALRNDQEALGNGPVGPEQIALWGSEIGGSKPKLDVTYTLSGPGTPAPLVVIF